MRSLSFLLLALAPMAAACGADDEEVIMVMEGDTGKADSPSPATLKAVVTATNKVSSPSDLAFNPKRSGELWVLNYDDDSVVIVHGATKATTKKSEYRKDGYAMHFMAWPLAIDFGADHTSFGASGTFATCGESRNDYNHTAPHNDFMGPTLWTSDLSIFAKQNPYGLGSHIDMLHETPLCNGIAHDNANVYWAVGGLQDGIYRYDFQVDHGVGQDDHSDGITELYATGVISRKNGVPMGTKFHSADNLLYVADTGNSRVLALDTTSASKSKQLSAPEVLQQSWQMTGAKITDFIAASTNLLSAPSGLEIDGNEMWVSDNANGRISVFDMQSGNRLRYYETGISGLGGIAKGPDNKLYIADMASNRVLRLEP
jgi:DNA-binding beta-propeller fold protein YncE